jgi:hypothetical protein
MRFPETNQNGGNSMMFCSEGNRSKYLKYSNEETITSEAVNIMLNDGNE